MYFYVYTKLTITLFLFFFIAFQKRGFVIKFCHSVNEKLRFIEIRDLPPEPTTSAALLHHHGHPRLFSY